MPRHERIRIRRRENLHRAVAVVVRVGIQLRIHRHQRTRRRPVHLDRRLAHPIGRQRLGLRVLDRGNPDILGEDRFMWGSDYPHDEGTHPYTREHLRQVFSDFDAATMRRILAENAAILAADG